MLAVIEMKKGLLAIAILIGFVDVIHSQNDIMYSHYFTTINYYNPAYAGKTGYLNTMGVYKQQWTGIKNAPGGFMVAADMPWRFMKADIGLGIVAVNEKSGLFSYTNFGAQLAYKRKWKKGILSIGLQAGVTMQSFDGTRSDPNGDKDDKDPTEPTTRASEDEAIPTTKINGNALDMNFGLFYHTDKWYAGIAVSHITEPALKMDQWQDNVPRTYNLTAGYNIKPKNSLFELRPSIFVMSTSQFTTGDITMRLIYNNMFSGGLGWRMNDKTLANNLSVYLGAKIWRFELGYAYEYSLSAISRGSTGSHELLATYRINIKKTRKDKNKHKSVRIL